MEKQSVINTEICKNIEDMYKLDHAHLIKYKNRLKSDISQDINKIIQMTKDA